MLLLWHQCRLPIKCLQNQPPMYQQTYQVSLSVADRHSGKNETNSFPADRWIYAHSLFSERVYSCAAENEGPSKQGSMHMSEQGVALCTDLSIWLQQTLPGQHCLVALDFNECC